MQRQIHHSPLPMLFETIDYKKKKPTSQAEDQAYIDAIAKSISLRALEMKHINSNVFGRPNQR